MMRVDCSRCDLCTVLSWSSSITNGVILPILALIVGLAYHGQCKLQPYIEVYLCVTAVLCLLNFSFSVTSACCLQRSSCICYTQCNNRHIFCALLVVEIILNVAIFFWLIAGSVWIYRLFYIMKHGAMMCNQTFYYLAFSLITIQWILFVIQHAILCMQTYFMPKEEDINKNNGNTSQTRAYNVIKQEENNNA